MQHLAVGNQLEFYKMGKLLLFLHNISCLLLVLPCLFPVCGWSLVVVLCVCMCACLCVCVLANIYIRYSISKYI